MMSPAHCRGLEFNSVELRWVSWAQYASTGPTPLSVLIIPALMFLALSFLMTPLSAFAQKKQVRAESTDRLDTLALVNGTPITSGDFLTRFEMSIYPGKDDPTMLEKIKRGFLNSMVAEKLLAEAAAHSDLPYTATEDLVRKELVDIFLRDALFRKEIVPRAKVTNDEVLHGFDISVYKYLVDAFYFESDSSKAREFYAIVAGKPRPNIYRVADSLGVSHDTLEIPYGESSEAIEDAFFGHTKGFISKPAVTVDGLVVFKVLSRKLNRKFISGSTPDRLSRIRQILVDRKQTDLGNEYIESVMRGVQVTVNYKIFRPLVYAIQERFEKQSPASYDPYYRLFPKGLEKLRDQFRLELNEPFLTFSGGSISLDEVFNEMPTAMFASDDATLPDITFALHASLRFISQNYFLVRRAKELGLENSWDVQHNVQMTLDALRAYRMANAVTDTVKVTPAEVDNYFAVHHDEVLNSIRLRLRMFEASTINEAVETFTRLNEQKDIPVDPNDTTARWVNAYNLGEIGAVLSQLKKGDVYGPVEERGKFYIYQLLDEKSSVNDAAIENSIDVAKQMLLAKEKQETLSRYIAGLAEKENVMLFRRNVLALKVTPFQMLTYRLIGFGGRVLAVPQLYPREGWVKYFHEQKKPPQP